MRFTPHHNWPVTEDTDVLKQFPATIDQPFKDSLDHNVPLTAENVDIYGAQINFPYLELRFGTFIDVTDANGLGTIVFKTPFELACHYVIPTIGGNGPSLVTPTSYSPASFQAVFYTAAGAVWANQSYTLNYLAIGA